MRDLLLFGLFGVISTKIILHENLGLSLEKRDDIFIHRKKPIETNVLVPLSVHVPEGPFQAESLASLQEKFGKVLDDEGLQYFHKNNTDQTYGCDSIRDFECQESWYKAGTGKLRIFQFLQIFNLFS